MKQLSILFIGLLILASSCKKEDEEELAPPQTPQERLVGVWIIDNTNFLANDFPGDGSYLQFNSCSGDCSGEDHDASDPSTGAFTYTLNGEASIAISDTMTEGGNYNATWDILTFTDSELRMTAEFFWAPMIVEMSKQ